MSRRSVQFGVALLLLAGVATLSAIGQSGTPEGSRGRPIRRVVLTGDEATAALARATQGSLVRLSPAEYDQLTVGPGRGPDRPRLVEARYRARLVTGDGDPHLVGTAEWSVRHPAGGEGVLPLVGLQLPVGQAKWSDGQDAVLYKAAGDPHPAVYLPAAGDRTLNLDWSARGVPEPGETRFELRLPVTPVAGLELVLPADVQPLLPQAEALLSGPFPVEAGTQSWRASFGGLSPLELVLRRQADGAQPLFVRTSATHRLVGTEGAARIEFQVESAKAGFAELTIEYDPDLTIASVNVNNLASWAADPGDGPDRHAVVRLREPTRSATVVVTGTFPIPWYPNRWTCPRARLAGVVTRSERERIVVGPAFRVSDWRPGGYRLVRAEAGSGRTFEIEVEPGPGPAGRSAPSLSVTPRRDERGPVVQHAEWVVGPRTESWVVRTSGARASAGPRALRFGLPDGWEVEEVTAGGQAVPWTVTDSAHRELLAESGPGPAPAELPELTVKLTRRPPAGVERRPFPDLYPIGARGRSGTLVIRPDSSLDVSASDPVPVRSTGELTEPTAGLTRPLAPEHLSGWLTIRPRPARAEAVMESEIVVGGDGEMVDCRLTVRPENGRVSEVTLWTPGPVTEPWVWRDGAGHRIADAERSRIREAGPWLVGIGSGLGPRAVASFAGASAAGCWWRLRFPSPLDQATTFTSSCRGPIGGGQLPIAWVEGMPFRCTVSTPLGVGRDRLDPRLSPSGSTISGQRVYRSDGDPSNLTSAPDPEVEGARLLTRIAANGECTAELRFRVRHWVIGWLDVTLPDGAERPSVLVADRPATLPPSGRTLRIPVPGGNDWTVVVVRYRLPAVGVPFSGRVQSPLPGGPFRSADVRRVWHISPTWECVSAYESRVVARDDPRKPQLPLPDYGSVAGPAVVPIDPAGQPLASILSRRFPGEPILIDTVALGSSDAPEPGAAGLVAVRSAAGVLITTSSEARQLSDEAVGGWLAEAAACGRDSSGRYRTLAEWQSAPPEDREALDAPPGWAILDGADAELTLVRRDRIRAATWGMALVIASGIWLIPRWRVRTAVLLTAVLGAVVAYTFASGFGASLVAPALFALVTAALIDIRRQVGTSSSDRLPIPLWKPAASGRATALVLVGAAWVSAQPGGTDEAYLIVGDGGRPSAVLVAPLVLERLRTDSPSRPDVVVTDAVVSGQRDGGVGRFRLRYRVFAFGAGPSPLTLPAAGVRVRAVTLDGAEPADLQAAGDQLRIPVSGRGSHTLEIDLTAPVLGTGSEKELRLPVPEVPASRLTFDLPAPGTRLRATNWRGAARVTAIGRSLRLEAEVGAVSTVAIRWQEGPEGSATGRVTEAAAWQFGPGSGTLTAALDYRITGGSVGEVQLAVPVGCEVYRVAARNEPAPATGPPALVRDWSVRHRGEAGRVLAVEFLAPVSGRLILNVELVPAQPPGDGAGLEFPRPLQVSEATIQAAVVSAGPELEVASADGFAPRPADDFQTAWKAIEGSAFPGKVVRAFQATGSRPRLVITWPSAEPAKSAAESVRWWFQGDRLVGAGETRWTGPNLGLIEWTFPADATITDLTARNLVGWSQSGGRVQAWFDRPTTDPVVTWRAVRAGGPKDAAVTIPVAGHPTARTDTIVTRVRGLDGWVLDLAGKTPSVDLLPAEAAGELAWQSAGNRTVTVRVLPPATAGPLAVQTAGTAGARLPANGDWHGRLSLVAGQRSDSPAVQRAQVIAARDGAAWLYRGRYLVSAGPSDRLRMAAPSGARWREVLQNGTPVPPGDGPVPLPATTGPRVLTLLWESAEPVWEPARVENDTAPVPLNGVDWTVVVPPGLRLEVPARETPGPATVPGFGDGWTEDREAFAGGAPHRFHTASGEGADVRLIPAPEPEDRWRLWVALVLWGGVAGMAIVRPRGTEPERAAGLGALAAVTFGAAGAAFWLVPVYAVGRRLWQFARRLAVRRPAGRPAEFLN
jgi:hypothetical protein